MNLNTWAMSKGKIKSTIKQIKLSTHCNSAIFAQLITH